MMLRQKMLLAQLPLGFAALLLGAVGTIAVRFQGETADHIVSDNYRSTLAAQRMAEAVERIDSSAMFSLIGAQERGDALANHNMRIFESELTVQQENITEPGEQEATEHLHHAWTDYLDALKTYRLQPQRAAYFEILEPHFARVKRFAGDVLTINQDAMVQKSNRARKLARTQATFLVTASFSALCCGIAGTVVLTRRLLRPLENLRVVARHLGEGDLHVRASVLGSDEIALLANDFNQMAARVQNFCQSSLGELLQAQASSQAAIDSFTDPVWVMATDGSMITCNNAASNLLLTEDERIWSTFAELNAWLSGQLTPLWERVIQRRGVWIPEGFREALQLTTMHGIHFYLPRATPLYGKSEELMGLTLVLQDVTLLRRIDELRDNMVATVAHEFRTPLTSLQMALHLCLEGTVGEMSVSQLDLLTAAREDCDRLRSMVDDLLNLSRLQRGEMSLARRSISVAALMQSAAARFEREAAKKSIRFVQAQSEIRQEIMVDAEKLHLVLANFLANAMRHTPQGGTVTFGADMQDSDVRFFVRDSGSGVATTDLPHVFERFYRSLTVAEEGAGLGLSIAREIVYAHGGHIGVSSPAGEGATFWFILPM